LLYIVTEKEMKLLIVDDSNIMRRAIQKYLAEFNLNLIGMAGDGESAVALCREFLPELVTLDITMPKMDGLTCLREILKINPETRVLIISALKDPATGLKALKGGAKGFLPKPFKAEDLRREIARLCGVTQ
jgi:two-component system chemotaxis response regulator CheY